MAATSKDEFVDLYEVLELATDTDAETIRKRLNELYLEAQQNLDHRNVKKRLQYQQMYEIYLPQARHLLLDPRRRDEYDRYLTAYRTGSKVAPAEQDADDSAEPIGEMSRVDEPPLPGMAEVEVDPEVVAAERENLWAKWKEGLQLVAEEEPATPAPAPAPTPEVEPSTEDASAAEMSAALQAATEAITNPNAPTPPPFARRPAPPPRSTSAAPGTRPAPPPPRSPVPPGSAPTRPTPPPARTPKLGRTPSIPSMSLESQEELEKQREIEHQRELERQRQGIVVDAVQNAGIVWGAIWGGVVFIVGCTGLFFLINWLKTYPLGLSSGVFSGLCLLFILILSAVGGSVARRKAEIRKASELSLIPTEDLLRRHRS